MLLGFELANNRNLLFHQAWRTYLGAGEQAASDQVMAPGNQKHLSQILNSTPARLFFHSNIIIALFANIVFVTDKHLYLYYNGSI